MKEGEADIAGGSGPREGFLCLQKAGGCLKAWGESGEREARRMGVRWEEQVDELMWEKYGALEEGSAGKEGRWRLSSGEQGGSWETSSPRRS